MPYRTVHGIPVWGEPQRDAVEQAVTCLQGAEAVVLMADHHLGYSQPVGGVVAYEGQVSPSGVGYDIGCGNKAVRLDIAGVELRRNIASIMDDVWTTLSFGIGRKNEERVDHVLFDDDPAWQTPIARSLKDKARAQLGTIGSGNHYVDLFTDEKDRVWIGVHFGSRGLGYGLATHYVRAGGGKQGMHVRPTLIREDSDLGREYIACMKLAGRYAYAGRDWVCDRVARLLGAHILEEVHNHHNYAWRETHDGNKVWVVRKGATPAFPGQRGFVGGSMGEDSVILEGVDSEESRRALYSTVHGAGRVMSRRQAKRVVSRDMMHAWIEKAGVTLRGAGLDESPHAYKRLADVLKAHRETIRVLHTLRPVGVAMAGAHEFDPYRD